jgi:hypothetical protein
MGSSERSRGAAFGPSERMSIDSDPQDHELLLTADLADLCSSVATLRQATIRPRSG